MQHTQRKYFTEKEIKIQIENKYMKKWSDSSIMKVLQD